MATVIALHRVTMSDPNADMIFTGAYDTAGNPILKKANRSILSGELFEVADPIELARLIEAGAVRYPSQSELQMQEN
jgi:hypothetical protein